MKLNQSADRILRASALAGIPLHFLVIFSAVFFVRIWSTGVAFDNPSVSVIEFAFAFVVSLGIFGAVCRPKSVSTIANVDNFIAYLAGIISPFYAYFLVIGPQFESDRISLIQLQSLLPYLFVIAFLLSYVIVIKYCNKSGSTETQATIFSFLMNVAKLLTLMIMPLVFIVALLIMTSVH